MVAATVHYGSGCANVLVACCVISWRLLINKTLVAPALVDSRCARMASEPSSVPFCSASKKTSICIGLVADVAGTAEVFVDRVEGFELPGGTSILPVKKGSLE